MIDKDVIIWGAGRYLSSVIDRIDPEMNIVALCDSDKSKWGIKFTKREIKCISPDELFGYNNIYVYICLKDIFAEEAIASALESKQIPYSHINNAILDYQATWEKKEIEKYDNVFRHIPEPDGLEELRYFVSISIPIEKCNLKCRYCYIGQHGQTNPRRVIYHSPEFIRKSLSRKRLRGTAMINVCGVGETLLCEQLLPVIAELLREGHYVSIITNALLKYRIEKLLKLSDELCSRLFFKCSLHYIQLKERKLLRLFSDNVRMIKESAASFSVELVPDDETAEYIDEIKKYALEEFGALPHLTVARDERQESIPILSKFSEEEYYKIWSSFKSEMFEYKMGNRKRICEYCLAGERSALFSLDEGEVTPCPFNKPIGNIYSDISKIWVGEAVGYNCCSPWCINDHAYLCLGLVRENKGASYLDIRDKKTLYGDNWIKPQMALFFSQRICDNLSQNLPI